MDLEHLVFALRLHPGCLPDADRAAALADPGFGRHLTDHMVTPRQTPSLGWRDGEVGPLSTLPMHLSAIVLHYAQVMYEGMKAYVLPDGGAALFRRRENARRLRRSAERLALEPVTESLFLEALRALVLADRGWIPTREGTALYLRSFLMGTEAMLGLKASSDRLFCVIATPMGSFFANGAAALRLWVSETISRASPGGTGFAKCGGNRGASLPAVAEARRESCDQPVFLDAMERRWVEASLTSISSRFLAASFAAEVTTAPRSFSHGRDPDRHVADDCGRRRRTARSTALRPASVAILERADR